MTKRKQSARAMSDNQKRADWLPILFFILFLAFDIYACGVIFLLAPNPWRN